MVHAINHGGLDYTLRLAGPDDGAQIMALVQSAYKKWVAVIGRNPLPMDVDYEQALGRHRFDLLCTTSNRQVPLAALLETYEQEDCLFIENLCVSPDHQRQGIGKRLLKHAEDIAAKTGKTCLRLDTNKLFTGNVALYQSIGYVTEWEKPVTGGIHVRMCKRL